MLRQRREMDHPAKGRREREREREKERARERGVQIQGRARKLGNGWSSTIYQITVTLL